MSWSRLWREFEAGDGFLLKLLQFVTLTGGLLVLGCAGMLDLDWPQQAVLGLLTIFIAIWIDHSSRSRLVTLTLMLFSIFATFRYGFWRVSSTSSFLSASTNALPRWTLDAVFIGLLLLAELYAFTVLLLGYMQTVWPLHRAPVPLPDDPADWPAVDLLIPTLNEPLSVVRHTALAALNIDWPADKLNIYLLDDGRREEFRRFAQQAGIGYMTRDDNQFAKAGNINHALERLDAPLVAVFDCDHAPTRSFLQLTVGWFLRDAKLAMLQTPQHLYSPDPFERNLDQFRVTPGEEELFYGVVQDGNDFWNATFFCGSCAVLRRSALDEIGGMAVETVTEDAHTSLRMQQNGWNTAYINIPQAAGLATERLRSLIQQRTRWARGMVQIMRTNNPLFARGLKLAQRLCYFNAMLHFLYAVPRLLFLFAPLAYLLFGRINVPGYWPTILAYAIPHLTLALIANARIQGSHRHSFWNQIYETVLSPFLLLPTLLALVDPRRGRFTVTPKGGTVERGFFDTATAWPFLAMIGLHLLAVLMAIPRLWHIPLPWLTHLHDGAPKGVVLINLIWATFNLVLLGVATAVAWETRQRRESVRLPVAMPADVIRADGSAIEGVTADISAGGALIRLDSSAELTIGERIQFLFPVLDRAGALPATVLGSSGNRLRAEFGPLTLQEEETLALVLYSRADTWLGWGEALETDHPLKSFRRILHLSFRGFRQTVLRSGTDSTEDPSDNTPGKRNLATMRVLLILVGVLAASSAWAALLQPPTASQATADPASQDEPRQPSEDQKPRHQAAPPIALKADLKLLPLPFYDPSLNSLNPPATVPIVFLSTPSDRALEAAGIVASWFGILADRHPVRFPVSVGSIPSGNAIVLTDHAEELPADLQLGEVTGPTIALRTNPANPDAKLLILTGKTGPDLLTAARALALGPETLFGDEVHITTLRLPPTRQYDDAPRWISTTGVTYLGDLAPADKLQRNASSPITVDLHLSPDLYLPPAQTLALHLNYRYNSIPLADASSLQIFLNGAFLSATPLPHSDKASAGLSTVIPVSAMNLRPGTNRLQMDFLFHPVSTDNASLNGAIEPNSYLDLRNTPHWTTLPDLALFHAAGFPFTRRADLADTAIVLPNLPSAQEIELYLTLMGHFGAQTGYPVLNVSVTNAAGMKPNAQKDYLVLGTVYDQPAISGLNRSLPVAIEPTGLRVQDLRSFFPSFEHAWWQVHNPEKPQTDQLGQLETTGTLPDAIVEGLEWPLGSSHSVVLIALRDDTAAPGFLSSFLEPSPPSSIAKSVGVLRGPAFSSYQIGDRTYSVGTLPLWIRIHLFVSQFPAALVLISTFVCFLMAIMLRGIFRRQASERLETESGSDKYLTRQ